MAVYFLTGTAGGVLNEDLCKIGYTSDDARGTVSRMASISTSCPFPTDLLWSIPGLDRAAEKEIHRLFAHDRVRREWFLYSEELVETADNIYIAVETHGPKKVLAKLKSCKTYEEFNDWV